MMCYQCVRCVSHEIQGAPGWKTPVSCLTASVCYQCVRCVSQEIQGAPGWKTPVSCLTASVCYQCVRCVSQEIQGAPGWKTPVSCLTASVCLPMTSTKRRRPTLLSIRTPSSYTSTWPTSRHVRDRRTHY